MYIEAAFLHSLRGQVMLQAPPPSTAAVVRRLLDGDGVLFGMFSYEDAALLWLRDNDLAFDLTDDFDWSEFAMIRDEINDTLREYGLDPLLKNETQLPSVYKATEELKALHERDVLHELGIVL